MHYSIYIKKVAKSKLTVSITVISVLIRHVYIFFFFGGGVARTPMMLRFDESVVKAYGC